MARVDDIISRISKIVGRGGAHLPADAAELADLYAQAVDDVNDRLSRCVALVRNGRRAEAVHLAELSPPLLEEAAKLEFPALSAWVDICLKEGMTIPPVVDGDSVQEINEAYPIAGRMERLLRAHRRLALGRGRLRERIKVLRHLSRSEPDNSAWGNDLCDFEKVRHAKIAEAAVKAGNLHDVAALEALYRECCEEPWLEKPAKALRESVEKLYRREKVRWAKSRMAEIGAALDQAYQMQDADGAAAALAEWDRVVAEASLDPGAVETASVADVRAWLQTRQQEGERAQAQGNACQALDHALDAKRPIDQLEKLWAKIVHFELPVPKTLHTRYQSRLQEHQLERSRRHRLVIMALLAGILALGGTVAGVLYWQVQERERTRWQTQIADAIEKNRLDEAQKLVDQLEREHGELMQQPELQSLAAQVRQRIEDDKTRVERFRIAIEQAEAAGASHPDLDALKTAEELARLDSERVRVEEVKSRIQTAALTAQRERDNAFSQSLDAVRQRFAEVKARIAVEPDSEQITEDLNKMRTELTAIVTREGVTAELLAAARSLSEAVTSTWSMEQRKVMSRQAAADALRRIPQKYGDPAALSELLMAFVKEHPGNAMSADFRRAADLAPGWRSTAAWSSTAVEMKSFTVNTRDEAISRIEVVSKLIEAEPQGAYVEALRGYLTHLERAKDALDSEHDPNQPGTDLYEMLRHPQINGLRVVHLRGGAAFYLKEREQPRELADQDSFVIKYVVTPDQALGRVASAEKFVRKADLVDGGKIARAPQSEFAAAAIESLAKGTTRWEARHLTLCTMVLKQEGIDPVLRVILCRELLRMAELRDWQSHPEIEGWLIEADRVVTNVPWMDPLDPAAIPAREEAVKVLAMLPPLQPFIDGHAAWSQKLADDLSPRSPIGLIWLDDSDNVKVEPERAVRPGVLETIARDGDGRWLFQRLGVIHDDARAEWTADAAKMPLGSIIFWRPGK